MAHGGENIFDTTVDAALVSQRNDQRQQQLDQLAEQNKKLANQQNMQQGGGGLPEGAVPVTVVEVQEVPGEGSKPEHKEEKKEEPDPFVNHTVLYNSFQRPLSYYLLRWLWCGCFEPRYKITSTYVIGEEWHGCCFGGDTTTRCCVRATDSMAFENVDDVERKQPCCYAMIGCCCHCFPDMGDISLIGGDESNHGGWTLKRIHQSRKIFAEMTRIIQTNNKLIEKDKDKKDKN